MVWWVRAINGHYNIKAPRLYFDVRQLLLTVSPEHIRKMAAVKVQSLSALLQRGRLPQVPDWHGVIGAPMCLYMSTKLMRTMPRLEVCTVSLPAMAVKRVLAGLTLNPLRIKKASVLPARKFNIKRWNVNVSIIIQAIGAALSKARPAELNQHNYW